MKKLITFATLALSLNAFAVGPAPKALQGGKITVTTADGKVYTFSSNEYAVVKRGTGDKVLTLAEGKRLYQSGKSQAEAEAPKNRITVHGGVGFDGNNVKSDNNQTTVSDKRSPVFGMSYSRKVNKDVSISGSALTNSTFLLGVGKDF